MLNIYTKVNAKVNESQLSVLMRLFKVIITSLFQSLPILKSLGLTHKDISNNVTYFEDKIIIIK